MGIDKARAGIRRRSNAIQYHAPDSRASASMDGALSEAVAQYSANVQKHVLRSATRAAALVFYEEMRALAPVASGALRASIFHYHDEGRSRNGRQVYLVGPNKGKAPHWFNVEYGHWRYNMPGGNGYWQRSKSNSNARGPGSHDLRGALPAPVWVPAHPYIRPTWDYAKDRAGQAAMQRMREKLAEIAGNSEGMSDDA